MTRRTTRPALRGPATPRVGSLLPGVFARLGLLARFERWRVVDEWPVIAGEALASYARAVSVEGDTLILAARDSSAMYHLSHLKPQLEANLSARSSGAVNKVRFVLGSS